MAYERGDQRQDYRYRDDDRWRDRRPSERGGYGRDDERGFFERAGDEVRSWFGDDDRGRERGWRGEQRRRDYGNYGSNWRGDHSTDRYGSGDYGGHDDYVGMERGAADTWGGSAYGGDYQPGRRFDRVDSGSTGTHGAHPMSAPVRGTAYGAGYGATAGGYGSSAREEAMIRGGRGATRGDMHDRHYSEWRNRQIEALDRDYDEYRREHQQQFEHQFAGWREKRQGQRESLRQVTEHMEVMGSDGEHIGTVDKVRGDRIVLTKSDPSAGGHHHSIPCSWIDRVDEKVMVNKSSNEAMAAWRDEDRNRALFERDDQGSEGPHVLNRSFSGTY